MDQQHQQLLAQQQQQLQQQLQVQHHLQQQQQGFNGNAYQSNRAFCFRYQPPSHAYYYQQQQQQQQQQPPYQLPVQVSQFGLVQPPGIPVLPGLDPVAAATAAVLSRLEQFAGSTVGVAGRPMYQQVCQPPYWSSGEALKGHQGNFGYSHMRPDGASPSFTTRAHGRGTGGPGNFPQHGVPSTSSHPEPSVSKNTGSENERAGVSYDPPHETDQAPATHPHEKSESVSAMETVVPYIPTAPVAGCEICKVRVTTLAVLEKHKNGKRHKKNMKKIEEMLLTKKRKNEEMKNAIKSRAELQGQQNRTYNSNMEVFGLTQSGEDAEDKKQTKNLPTEAVSHVKSAETGQQNNIPGQQRGSKHKLDNPLYRDLCNIERDRQVIFDRHLSGKKHLANFKRSKGHQAIKGPVGLQALYPPNPNAKPLFHPQEGKYMPSHVYQDIPVETSSSSLFREHSTIEVGHSRTRNQANCYSRG